MSMDKLRDKRNIKIVSLVIAAFFVLGILGMALSQTTSVGSAAAANSGVGVVNWQSLVVQHPDMATLKTSMDTEVATAKKEFEEKAKTLNQEEQQRYYMQLQERLANKERELMVPLMDKINAAIKKVATTKGLSVVVDKQSVIYGGTDITEDVIKAYK
ncbi:OmpH family outer membrane protein [Succinispira mobilis]|uniref:OmpH family outer membrane protein n=1 Tax=Succinispira mobilis TaxID=78120 RepID=UPI00036E4F5D|nr:OmpH family outer membrane protein [Succinispira mobilis]